MIANRVGPVPNSHIKNLGIVVDDYIYRGANPSYDDLRWLKAFYRIKTVVDLRYEALSASKINADDLGLYYYRNPIVDNTAPLLLEANALVEILTDITKSPFFIHCQKGCGRTGTVVAYYRVKVCNWSLEEAIEEAQQYSPSVLGWHPFRALNHTQLDFLKLHAKTGV